MVDEIQYHAKERNLPMMNLTIDEHTGEAGFVTRVEAFVDMLIRRKEIEYLYRPLFNIDVPFEEHSYVSVHEDYWNPKFWADILSPICDVKKDVKDVNYFKGKDNMIRNIGNMYWGYAQLDPIKRIPTFKESIKDLYRQYIAPLF